MLPFENLSGGREQDYFADGMTDALITNLAQVRALRVISRTSVMQYKQTNKLLPRIADDLNVDAVVEGTVVRSGDRVRVTAQLIHASTDRHLWARTYERELRDVLALQAELAGAIAQAVEVKVQPEERRRLAARGSVNPDAYDAYLKGRFFWNRRSPEDLVEGGRILSARDRARSRLRARLFGLVGRLPHVRAAGSCLHASACRKQRPRRGRHWPWMTRWPKHTLRWPVSSTDTSGTGRARKGSSSAAWSWIPSYAEGHRAYAIYLLTVRRTKKRSPRRGARGS